MKKTLILFMTVIAMLAMSVVVLADDQDLISRIEALEKENKLLKERVYRLESSVFEEEIKGMVDAINGWESESEEETGVTLYSGTYVVGEDLDAGKYNIKIEDGVGTMYIFPSYDIYVSSNKGLLEALSYQYVASDEYIQGLKDSEYISTMASIYTSNISNIRLTDGVCVVLDTVTATFSKQN